MAEIKLMSECFVKPKYEVKDAKKPYNLNPFEITLLSIEPIKRGLLFTLNTTSTDRTKTISNLLEKLKESLSLALVHFYPLAGQFSTHKYPDEHACSIFVECTKGPGAKIIHASALGVTTSDILSASDVPKIVWSFFEMGEEPVNYDGHTRPLLSTQVTELIDGLFLGFSMNHSVVDGTSFIHVVSMLSEIFRSYENIVENSGLNKITISRMPVFNYKPKVYDTGFSNENDVPFKLPHLEPEEFIVRRCKPDSLRDRIFHFSPTSMEKLKAKANQEYGTTQYVISSFQALTALVWRSITRARNLKSGESTCCNIMINIRNRFDPPISDDYFGNLVSGALWICKVEELLGHDLGWVASNLRKAILSKDKKSIVDEYKCLARSPIVFRPGVGPDSNVQHKVVIGGSARFDMYGLEFGLGRALAVRMGYGNREDGKITVNPGCEGGGSVDLEISLRPHVMAALEVDADFMSFVSY